VGRELGAWYPKRYSELGNTLLRVENLTREPRFRDVSFEVRAGEIVGMAGLVGAGRTDVGRAIFGADRPQSGKVYLEGEPIDVRTPEDAIALGIGYVPEDRKDLGLFLGLNIRQNIGAASLKANAVGGIMRAHREIAMAEEYVERLSIRTPTIYTTASNLSGGNQQKVLLAKWLAIHPRLLIVDEPTRGVDVGAKAEVHSILRGLARSGVAILMISSELPEILGASDRVLVMHEGQLMGELSAEEATEEKIMFLAAGRVESEPDAGGGSES